MSLRRSGRHVSGLQVAVINSSGPSLRACKVVADVWKTKYVQPHRNERLPPSFSFKHPCLQSQVEPKEWTRMVFWRRWVRWWFRLWQRFLLRRLFLVSFGQFKWQVGFFIFQKNCMRRMEQKENMMVKGIALELGCCSPKL